MGHLVFSFFIPCHVMSNCPTTRGFEVYLLAMALLFLFPEAAGFVSPISNHLFCPTNIIELIHMIYALWSTFYISSSNQSESLYMTSKPASDCCNIE